DGTVSTTVTTTDGKNFDINDGTTRGTNLFHSFKEFSVPTGGSANFNNAANIQNIISRVTTAGSISNIDGLIKANGAANLFLLNPAGIIFGPNASLKIGGSFLGSTANSFIFDNGFEFSATNPQAPPLLTINLPIGLRYGDNPGEIKVAGRGHDINFQDIKQQPRPQVNNSVPGLELQSGKTLALVGGKVSFEGGILKSPAGRIEIGSVASNGTVSLVPVQEGWKLGYESITSFGDIRFSGRTLLDTTGVGGGSIAVAGKNINFTGESILLADTLGDRNGGEISIVGDEISVIESEISSFTFSSGNAGQVKLIANKSILLENNGGAGTNTLGLGKAGEITVKADSIEVRNSSRLGSNTFGKGDAGQIEVKANSLLIEKNSGFGTSSNAEGNAGEISVNIAGPLVLRNNASMNSNTSGTGNAGKISITANSLLIEDRSGFNIGTEQGSTGQAGEINVNIAGPLEVRKNSGINSSTSGTGNAGKISITANSLLIEDSSGFSNGTEQGSTGQGGEINLNIAGPLVTRRNAGMNSNTYGTGNAGKISITANSLLISDSAGFESTTKQGSTGQGGEINVNIAGPLVLRNKAGIDSNTSGTGDAGQITVSAESVEISNDSGISLRSLGSGNAGNLNVRAKTVILDNEGRLRVSSTGSGNAGTLKVVADTIKLDNQSQINATTTSGNGGNLTLNVANLLLLRRESFISTSAGTAGTGGDGGNITINSPLIVAFPSENSDITANAFSGSGGNIKIKTQGLFGIEPRSQLTPESDITAFSQQNPSLSGTVNINTPDVDPSRGLFELSETVIDPAQQIAQNPCLRGGGEFIITGRGGLPTDPNKVFSSDNVRVDLVKPVASTTSNNSTSTTKEQQPSTNATTKEIVPARGWIFNEKGEVVLVAYDPTKTGVQRSSPTPASNCAAR
ncbi:MAG: filamentous hemagglutinin N-terminal domain-containing protein, partial [Brasilonema sp.]